jgi:uncharacterized protein
MLDTNLTIALEPRHQDQLLGIIRQSMEGTHGTVFLFGSRARGASRPASDIDLAVALPENTEKSLSTLRENLENSTIPYSADVVDLNTCAPELAEIIQREGVLLWND